MKIKSIFRRSSTRMEKSGRPDKNNDRRRVVTVRKRLEKRGSLERNTQGPVQAIDRVLDIIETLSASARGMQLGEIATAVGLHVSTTHRLLTSLSTRGYVFKDTESGRYRLTTRMFEIGSGAIGENSLLAVAKPYMEALSAQTVEVIHIAIPDGDSMLYLHKEDPGVNIVRMGSRTGMRGPLFCTGAGKALMSGWTNEEVADRWPQLKVVRYTNNTIVTLEKMLRELDRIRKRGYAFDNEEHELGVRCVAAAIKNHANIPVAALSISTPASRMNDREAVLRNAQRVMQTAETISAQLGLPQRRPATARGEE